MLFIKYDGCYFWEGMLYVDYVINLFLKEL